MTRIAKILLLILTLLCFTLPVLAESSQEIVIQLREDRLPVFEAGASQLEGLLKKRSKEDEAALPVIVLPVKRSYELSISVSPRSLRDRRVDLSVKSDKTVRVRGNTITGLAAGETILTIASRMDPNSFIRYRVLVVQPVTRIQVEASKKIVAVGKKLTLKANIQPENATLQNVKWSTDDARIATVDSKGVVKGVKRGSVRIVATAIDGSNIRASFNIQVTQNPESITLDKPEVTIDVGRNTVVRATVLPQNTNDKGVVWTSSDPSVATVNNQGRITAVSLGECEVTCTSKVLEKVMATVKVHTQQPIKNLTLGQSAYVYVDENAQLTWTIEPANATNQTLKFTSNDERIVKVNSKGKITGVKGGEAYITAVTTDGTNRRARVKVYVYEHVQNVHMKRLTAYLDIKDSDTCSAVFEPEKYTNHNMTWVCDDPSIASAERLEKQPWRVKITGVSLGETVIRGTTEDGGLQTSIDVKIGDWDHSLKLRDAHVEGEDMILSVSNVSSLTITSITAEVSVFDDNGNPVPCNSKNDSCSFKMMYKHTLNPGERTSDRYWKNVDYKRPESLTVSEYVVKVTQFQIDNDWIKTIRKFNQPTKKCPVHN